MPKTKRRWLRRATRIGLAVMLLLAAYLWFGGSPIVPRGPVHLKRGPSGNLLPPPGESPPRGATFEAHVGKMEANDSFFTGSSMSNTGSPGFPCRRVTIINKSDTILMQCVGARLLAELDKTPIIEEIDYYPAGFSPADGEAAPDVVVNLDLTAIQESGFIDRKVDATITITAGNAPAHCRASYSDSSSPPVISYDWSSELHHQSTTRGIASSAARYAQVSDDIAKQIALQLSKFLSDAQKTYGPPPPLPSDFFPAYRPPPTLPFPPNYHATRIISNHGLMYHDQTFWQLTTDKDTAAALTEIKTSLEQAGWRTTEFTTTPPSIPRVRLAKEGAMLTVFPQDQGNIVRTAAIPPSTAKPTVLIVQYTDPLTPQERDKAIAATFNKDVPLDAMLLFQYGWQPEQRKLALARCEAEAPTTPWGAMVMARLLHSEKRDDEARAALRHVFVTMITTGGAEAHRSEMDALAKELGIKLSDDAALNESSLLEAGFLELKPGLNVPDVKLSPNQGARYFGTGRDGQVRTFLFYLSPAVTDAGRRTQQITFQETTAHDKRWSMIGTTPLMMPLHQSEPLDAVATVSFEINQAGSADELRVATHVENH